VKRKLRKPTKKRTEKKAHLRPARSIRKPKNKRRSTAVRIRRRRHSVTQGEIQSPVHTQALAALARMRRDNISLSKAARLEHIKPDTVLRHVGSAVHRSGPGKPWKATKSDSLKARMRILTPKAPVLEVVRSSRERILLGHFETAIRMFRAGEDGAEKELQKFQGLKVAGHVLVTDLDLLIQLEEAGQLDFDNLYYSVGGGS